MLQGLKRYSSFEPEVSDAINTLLQKKIVEYDEETNTLTVNVDIKLKFFSVREKKWD